MYAAYDENEIGALDCEEIEGHVAENSEILLQYAEEFEKSRAREQLDKEISSEVIENLSSTESGEELVEMEVPEKEKWDCQSILSTYSDIYNHPKLISEPKVSYHFLKINFPAVNMFTGHFRGTLLVFCCPDKRFYITYSLLLFITAL